MPDFKSFDEGRMEIGLYGLPATVHFLLSTKAVDPAVDEGIEGHADGSTLAGGVAEIYGTGYERTSEPTPTPTLGNPVVIPFPQQSWATRDATDWPSDVRSCVAVTSADDNGKVLCVWNLIKGGAARDLSQASTTEHFTPTLTLV